MADCTDNTYLLSNKVFDKVGGGPKGDKVSKSVTKYQLSEVANTVTLQFNNLKQHFAQLILHGRF